MAVIKRYSNRKLYDTEAKRYVSLRAIAALIRDGTDVQVIDHDTGDDITTRVLSQIILAQEKQGRDSLPKALLAGLVRASDATLGMILQGLSAPLALSNQVDAEIDRRLAVLAASGEIADDERQRLREKLLMPWTLLPWIDRDLDVALERALTRRGAASRSDLRVLSQQIDALALELDELAASRGD